MAFNNKNAIEKRYRVNDEITLNKYKDVRLIHPSGENEICNFQKAIDKANEYCLDLIEINNKGDMPVLKIADYQKMIYELKKNAKKQSHNTKPLKEIQLSVSIAENDMKTKANNARRFLKEGSKVKVVLTMKGREKQRREENKKSIYQFIEMLSDISTPESFPKDEGDSKTIVILKKKN